MICLPFNTNLFCFKLIHVLDGNLVWSDMRIRFRDVLGSLSVLLLSLVIPVLFAATLFQKPFYHLLPLY